MIFPFFFSTALALALGASDPWLEALTRPVLDANQSGAEVRAFLEQRILPMPRFASVADWERYSNRMREQALDTILRGEAATWSEAPTRVEWLGEAGGGEGYRIQKLRYEALPGLWIPALLYVPEQVEGKVPAILNVNGHDRQGKAAPYKQIRCINQARRGMLALNVEWFGMGQLRTDNFLHYRINQLDLCGTSGVAVHYLYLKRAIDLLLSLEQTDPQRIAVTGLSGGGWQTIFISALDQRVRLANPVAGYSSYQTRVRFLPDLGDSEQTPSDLAWVTDYAHLTAMLAPRPLLLTYNAKDQCCFRADYALTPLLEAARPVFDLYGRSDHLRFHVNQDPGTHNYEKENREAFYRMVGDFFYGAGSQFKAEEIPSESEIKSKEELEVELPSENADFHRLALDLSQVLPRQDVPLDATDLKRWQMSARARLKRITRMQDLSVRPEAVGRSRIGDIEVTHWKLGLNDTWTVPAVEFAPPDAKSSTVMVADEGRQGLLEEIRLGVQRGERIIAVDPFYFGESAIRDKDFLFALLVAAVGERPLGLQAGQLAGIARWLRRAWPEEEVRLMAKGPRSSLFSLIAAAVETESIHEVSLQESFGSLREIIERNLTAREHPELFCFGLLESFDIRHLAALAAPRAVRFLSPSDRLKTELAPLEGSPAGSGIRFGPASEQ